MDELRIVLPIIGISTETNILRERENDIPKKSIQKSDNDFYVLFRNELSKNCSDPDETIKNYNKMKGKNK